MNRSFTNGLNVGGKSSFARNKRLSLVEWRVERLNLGGIAMACSFCTSKNQTEFPAEVNIHFPDLRNVDKVGVFVFPRLLVCRDCGSSSFMTPAPELAQLCAADQPLA